MSLRSTQQGNEVWRCVMEGHDERVKVYPDGRQERFDGPKNRPPKALHETLKYRPRSLPSGSSTSVLIFKWYTTEAISPGQIAARLNDLGVSPVYGPLWHQGGHQVHPVEPRLRSVVRLTTRPAKADSWSLWTAR